MQSPLKNADLRARLRNCFLSAFPALTGPEVEQLSVASFPAWDSLATVTLMSVIEEEFGVSLEAEELEELISFDLALDLLQRRLGVSES